MEKGEILHMLISMLTGLILSLITHLSLGPLLSYYGVGELLLFLLLLPIVFFYTLKKGARMKKALLLSVYISLTLALTLARHFFFSTLYYRVVLRRTWEESLEKGFIAGLITLFLFFAGCQVFFLAVMLSSTGKSW